MEVITKLPDEICNSVYTWYLKDGYIAFDLDTTTVKAIRHKTVLNETETLNLIKSLNCAIQTEEEELLLIDVLE